jgi:uncharacterized protein (TIGR00645 family)
VFERILERFLFGSRWAMVPFFVGLLGALCVLLLKFLQKLAGTLTKVVSLSDTDVIMATLSLIDLALAASLVIIVVFSGYENFVSKLDIGDHKDRPDWMGKVDFAGLKLKLVASIVAISAIHLLKTFMDIHQVDKADVLWQVVIHVSFVISGVLLAVMDLISARCHGREALAQSGEE